MELLILQNNVIIVNNFTKFTKIFKNLLTPKILTCPQSSRNIMQKTAVLIKTFVVNMHK